MLADCQVLRIEDVLPFFPDFVVIDDFKARGCLPSPRTPLPTPPPPHNTPPPQDQINLSLEEYNERIRDLRAEMDEFTRAAERIRRDIKGLRNRYGYVSLGQRCDLSGQPVLSGPFYIFPCTHVFLAEALVREVRARTSAPRRLPRAQPRPPRPSARHPSSLGPPSASSSAACGWS